MVGVEHITGVGGPGSAYPRRMKENILIGELVVAVMVPPTATVRDVALSDGLVARLPSPFSRYGGV